MEKSLISQLLSVMWQEFIQNTSSDQVFISDEYPDGFPSGFGCTKIKTEQCPLNEIIKAYSWFVQI